MVSACGHHTTEAISDNTIPIDLLCDPNKTLSVNELSDKIHNIRLIPLSTQDEGLIGRVDKLIHSGNKYYIVDKKQFSIFCFDDSGKFISKLYRYGRGPQEYLDITDVLVNEQGVTILDCIQNKIYTYGIDGSYRAVRSLAPECLPCGLIYMDSTTTALLTDGSYVEETGSDHYVTTYGLDGKSTNAQLSMPRFYCKEMTEYNMREVVVGHSDEQAWFNLPYDNRLICMKDSSISACYQFTFNGTAPYLDQYKESRDKTEQTIFDFSDQTPLPNITLPIFNKENFFVIHASIQDNVYMIVYDKTTQSSRCYHFQSMDPDLQAVNFLSSLSNGEGNSLYAVVYPMDIHPEVQGVHAGTEINAKYKALQELHAAPDDNPIIVSFELGM